mmetsp:Transcript_30441/g.78828  ORF Transcript_30441/g.78828 Transcript_30441/m.78828 type:complete len:246 (-) Transcript_30441:781-1518(-)
MSEFRSAEMSTLLLYTRMPPLTVSTTFTFRTSPALLLLLLLLLLPINEGEGRCTATAPIAAVNRMATSSSLLPFSGEERGEGQLMCAVVLNNSIRSSSTPSMQREGEVACTHLSSFISTSTIPLFTLTSVTPLTYTLFILTLPSSMLIRSDERWESSTSTERGERRGENKGREEREGGGRVEDVMVTSSPWRRPEMNTFVYLPRDSNGRPSCALALLLKCDACCSEWEGVAMKEGTFKAEALPIT